MEATPIHCSQGRAAFGALGSQGRAAFGAPFLLTSLGLLLTLLGCAKVDDSPICRPGERRCQDGTAQFCDDRGRWSVPEICAANSACVDGTCQSACGDTCRPGEKRCSPAGPQACDRTGAGCGAWGQPVPCGLGEVCQDGVCQKNCPIQCTDGQTRCVGPNAFVVCDVTGACPKWIDWQGCPPDEEGGVQTCTGGTCHAAGSCADQCRDGEIVCLTEVQSQVCARTAEGCLDWAAPLDCPADQRCHAAAGCGARCMDECQVNETRCDAGGVQTCVAGAEGCTVWGAISACPGACAEGACQDVCQPDCAAGAQRCGPGGGVQACESLNDCLKWGSEVACAAGEQCAGEGVCGVCEPGATEAQGCGNCGTQTRACGDNRQWSPWGECAAQGECMAGQEQACGRCGVQRCGQDCHWGGCENEGPCTAGQTQPCGNCGTATCNGSCQWGGCGGEGVCAPGATDACNQCGNRGCTGQCSWEPCNNGDGTLWRRCNDCGWQFCCPNGDWCGCAAHFSCNGGSCGGAGVCQ